MPKTENGQRVNAQILNGKSKTKGCNKYLYRWGAQLFFLLSLTQPFALNQNLKIIFLTIRDEEMRCKSTKRPNYVL